MSQNKSTRTKSGKKIKVQGPQNGFCHLFIIPTLLHNKEILGVLEMTSCLFHSSDYSAVLLSNLSAC